MDYDGDGETEVISTYGTCPETRIYDWRDGALHSCNVNDALEAAVLEQTGSEVMAAVCYNEAENRFEYSVGLDGTPVQGELTIPRDENQ